MIGKVIGAVRQFWIRRLGRIARGRTVFCP
jgi:hypothetical protein